MPNPLKVWSVGLGLGQLALLSVTFSEHKIDTVSTNLMEFPQFNLWLTMTVTAQIVTAGLYMAVMRDKAPCAFVLAVLACLLALVGWAILVVYTSETHEHQEGAGIFIVSSAIYSIIMIYLTYLDERNTLIATPALVIFFLLYIVTGGLLLGFIINNFAGNTTIAATCEWAAFMSQAVNFSLFFATHSFADTRGALMVDHAPLHYNAMLP
jgi:drug/metabolite transporter (DMT)-like permease